MKLNRLLVLASFLLLFSCTEKKKEIELIPVDEPAVEVIDTVGVEEIYDEPKDILEYTVQIGAYSKENIALETSVDNIIAVNEDGLIKYRLGDFSTYASANKLKNALLSDYSDAFIVAIYNGNRIDIAEALDLSGESEN